MSTGRRTAWSGRLVMGTLAITAASGGLLGLAVVLPFVMSDLDVRPAVAALVMPAAYVGCATTSVMGGRAADRFGGSRISAAGLVTMTLGVLIASQASAMWVYLIGACVTGLGYGAVNPATSVMVDPGGAGGRGVLLSIKQAGVTLGGALTGVLLPVVAEHSSWPVALAGAALLQLTVGLSLLGVPEVPRAARGDLLGSDDGGYHLRPLPGGLYGLTMAGAQLTAFGLMAVYLTEELGVSPIVAGVIYGSTLLLAVVARIGWGVASDRRPHDRSRPLQVCSVMGVLGFVGLAVPVPAVVVAACVLIGAGAAAWNGAYIAAVMTSASAGEGAAIGQALLLINVGCMGGPLLAAGILAATHSWVALWLTMAVVQAVGFAAVTRATQVGRVVPAAS